MQGNNPYPSTSRSAEFAAVHDRQDRERDVPHVLTGAECRRHAATIKRSLDDPRLWGDGNVAERRFWEKEFAFWDKRTVELAEAI